jgi:hypothetical protein
VSVRDDVVPSCRIECRAYLHANIKGLPVKQLRVNRVHDLADAESDRGPRSWIDQEAERDAGWILANCDPSLLEDAIHLFLKMRSISS